jgi:hypothetical protein
MMKQFKREITISYVRHPYTSGGVVVMDKTETAYWFCTVYDNGRKLSDTQARHNGLKQFLNSGIPYVSLGARPARITKKVEY